MFLGRIIVGFIKQMLVEDDAPMRPNSPTVKSLIIDIHRDLTMERQICRV